MGKPTFEIAKLDEERMLVFGYASVAVKSDGETVVDSQGDVIAPNDLENAAYDFVLHSRDGGVMHQKTGVARLVESFFINPEKLQKLGLSEDALPQGWWIGMKVDDPAVWKRVKSGELKMFSIGGRGRREPIK